MKSKEIKNKNEGELEKMLEERAQALKNFRFAISGSKTKNVKEGRMIRKDIAKILTEMNAKKK